MNKKFLRAVIFVLSFSGYAFAYGMQKVTVFQKESCVVRVSMLKWWKDFSPLYAWYDQDRNNIVLPPLPHGFGYDFFQDARYNNDTVVCFRCNSCKAIVHYNEMYRVLKKRKNVQKFNKIYSGCRNCYINYSYWFKNGH